MNEPLPAPFDNPELREKLEEYLIRKGIDDRVTHSVIYNLANIIAPYLK